MEHLRWRRVKNVSYIVELPVGMQLMNANDREHWSKRARVSSLIRTTSRGLCKGIPKGMKQVKIRAIYYAPDNRRRDVSNLFPSVKAAVDGLVDAGVIKDDNDKYVVALEMVRGEYNIPKGQLVIEIIEVEHEGVTI
jgi:crossover junction endodeoxyribonuclease RusA